MKFSEIPYNRPDIEIYKKTLVSKIEQFIHASTPEQQIELWREINLQEINFWTNATLVSIRNSLNTKDEFYKLEKEFRDEIAPTLEDLYKEFRRAVLVSKFRKELQEVFGKHVIDLFDFQEKTFSSEIIEDEQELNKLVSEYVHLIGSAEFDFQGDHHNLSTILKFATEGDREVRLQAMHAKYGRYEKNDTQLNSMYDAMVKVRHGIAKKMGYKDFVAYGYDKLLRVDYNPQDIEKFRQAIVAYVVPVCNELYALQAQLIGVDKIYYHDESVYFPQGNPKPLGSSAEIIDKAKQMYHDLSPETGKFFDTLLEHEMFDLETRIGKSVGGYCTSLEAYKLPFVFANFNGTTDDIDVLTHEIGHAFQVWSSMQTQPIQQYYRPTSETAEIHSMSMEYLTLPWMKNFFAEETLKYEYLHLISALTFAPYGCAVDEFQQRVYEQAEHPVQTYEEIRQEMEKKYLPHRTYDMPYLQQGNQRKQKHHIFEYPLYYIDYVLAHMCALQFWMRSQQDFSKAWQDYVALCKLGGSKPFQQLLQEVRLDSPFELETIQKVMHHAHTWIKNNPLTKL